MAFKSNVYDWLGHGRYFWENSPARALAYAQELQQHPERANTRIEVPAVIGAVIDLGDCLDLTEMSMLRLLRLSYDYLEQAKADAGEKLPANRRGKSNSDDLLLRQLDCAVIENLHDMLSGQRTFDSVRGVFWEGDELYPNAGFREKNHIQLCIRNPNCIKGYFWPRQPDRAYDDV